MRVELLRSPLFQRMGQSVDEDEHSIEMHLPYVAHVRPYLSGSPYKPSMSDFTCISHHPPIQNCPVRT